MTDRTFPNLFIIGAMKSGTTSLHECLDEHPEIFMARFKEPQYFAPHRKRFHGHWGQGHELPEPGIGWYLRLFDGAGGAAYAGESSTSYTKEPWVTGCARRIHAFNAHARLIYLMRDPVERTISHYWHNVVGFGETRPPLEAIRGVEEYMAYSHYARQLRPYLETFGPQAVYLLTLEGLVTDPGAVLRDLFTWLEVDPDVAVRALDWRNASPPTVLQVRRGFELFARARFHWRWRTFQAACPGMARLINRAMSRRIDRAGVDLEPVVDYLRPIQREQTKELTDLVGRAFPEWKTLHGSGARAPGAGPRGGRGNPEPEGVPPPGPRQRGAATR